MGQKLKTPKGEISVTNCQERIRLRWRNDGERYSLNRTIIIIFPGQYEFFIHPGTCLFEKNSEGKICLSIDLRNVLSEILKLDSNTVAIFQ